MSFFWGTKKTGAVQKSSFIRQEIIDLTLWALGCHSNIWWWLGEQEKLWLNIRAIPRRRWYKSTVSTFIWWNRALIQSITVINCTYMLNSCGHLSKCYFKGWSIQAEKIVPALTFYLPVMFIAFVRMTATIIALVFKRFRAIFWVLKIPSWLTKCPKC